MANCSRFPLTATVPSLHTPSFKVRTLSPDEGFLNMQCETDLVWWRALLSVHCWWVFHRFLSSSWIPGHPEIRDGEICFFLLLFLE